MSDLQPLINEQQSLRIANRPCFHVLEHSEDVEGHGYLREGVWHFDVKNTQDDSPAKLTAEWLSTPIIIEALTADLNQLNFGRLLRYKNLLGAWKTWAMPMNLLGNTGSELRSILLSRGVLFDPNKSALLIQYIFLTVPDKSICCTNKVGWHNDNFVFPEYVIGPSASSITFQSGDRFRDEISVSGTLQKWQKEVSDRAVGNPLLIAAISAAFAGPLLTKCHVDAGGIHYFGDSSIGKSTLLVAATSVWGGVNYRRSWKSTANGMESVATIFNDLLLAIDEIGECAPKEVGSIIYALGNGIGKQRANSLGHARSVSRWKCMVLSSGEKTIATIVNDGRQEARAGQAVRLLDVPANRKFGVFDFLHEFKSGAALSDAIRTATTLNYGHAGPQFVEYLTRESRNLLSLLDEIKALPEFSVGDEDGQDKRVATRLSLIALAGELAIEWEIVNWEKGAAITAAATVFNAWRSHRGEGNAEKRQVLEQLKVFLEKYGETRFSNADATEGKIIRNRAGWWRNVECGRIYLINSAGMKDALAGFDFKTALDILEAAGVIEKNPSSSERSSTFRIQGQSFRLYCIERAKLEI
jgi:putative DNA primase/helicase